MPEICTARLVRAGWVFSDLADVVHTAVRAVGHVADVGTGAVDVSRLWDVTNCFFVLPSPCGFGAIELFEIRRTGIFVAVCPRHDKVGNGDSGQEPDDGNDNHDFN